MLLNYQEILPVCRYYVQLIGKLCLIEKYAFLSELFILEKCNSQWWCNIWWWMTVVSAGTFSTFRHPLDCSSNWHDFLVCMYLVMHIAILPEKSNVRSLSRSTDDSGPSTAESVGPWLGQTRGAAMLVADSRHFFSTESYENEPHSSNPG